MQKNKKNNESNLQRGRVQLEATLPACRNSLFDAAISDAVVTVAAILRSLSQTPLSSTQLPVPSLAALGLVLLLTSCPLPDPSTSPCISATRSEATYHVQSAQ
jgi:hypothetical protein